MSVLDFDRLSSFVGGIVDRKMKALSMSITSSTGFLRSLVTQSQANAQSAQSYAQTAQNYSQDADGSAASAQTAYNTFAASYGGLKSTDPTQTLTNGTFNVGAVYIRSSDSRFRYVQSLNGSTPVWADAQLAADPASVISAATGKFLSLTATSLQTVAGPTNFSSTVTAPAVTNWTSSQVTTANDVTNKINTVVAAISAETNRATLVESNLSSAKADKSSLSAYVLTAQMATYFASPSPIGSNAANTGTFTSLLATQATDSTHVDSKGYSVRVRRSSTGIGAIQFTDVGATTQLGLIYHDGVNLNLIANVGAVLVPTASAGDNTQRIASTAFVTSALGNYVTNATLNSTFANSPSLGGSPTATTPGAGDNSNRIATTAFVRSNALGFGQNLTGYTQSTRSWGVTYYNTTSLPIFVSFWGGDAHGGATVTLYINGGAAAAPTTNYNWLFICGIIPPGASYMITSTGGTWQGWTELR